MEEIGTAPSHWCLKAMRNELRILLLLVEFWSSTEASAGGLLLIFLGVNASITIIG